MRAFARIALASFLLPLSLAQAAPPATPNDVPSMPEDEPVDPAYSDDTLPPSAVPAPTTDAAPAKEDENTPIYRTVVLQGLNKVTGHISKLEAPVGTVIRFDKLEIIARRCWKSPPEEQPENAALLEISELKAGEAPQKIFLGWMFSSSPGLSSIEHPVYDITVLSCEESKGSADPYDADKPKDDKPADKADAPKPDDKPAKPAADKKPAKDKKP